MKYEGIWHIKKMSNWDEDFYNMEVQAYLNIKSHSSGEFQFGLVSGQIDGEYVKYPDGNRFEFSWQGMDECEEVSGSGWLKIENDIMEGNICFFQGDTSTFLAHRFSTK